MSSDLSRELTSWHEIKSTLHFLYITFLGKFWWGNAFRSSHILFQGTPLCLCTDPVMVSTSMRPPSICCPSVLPLLAKVLNNVHRFANSLNALPPSINVPRSSSLLLEAAWLTAQRAKKLLYRQRDIRTCFPCRVSSQPLTMTLLIEVYKVKIRLRERVRKRNSLLGEYWLGDF